MPSVSSPRVVVAAVVLGAALLGPGEIAVAGASASAGRAAASPPSTVAAARITRRPGTLAPGTGVRAADIFGHRVFTDAGHGFALASVGDADYPVASVEGGRTWKTDGPALHLHAAQAPLAVVYIDAVNAKTVFAWGGGQVIDATGDGGKNWYRALFTDGGPLGVVPRIGGGLAAFVGSSNGATIWQYVSKDSGRTWHYRTTVGQ
ncbi:MAG: hypothetical protein JO168_14310 [Solirubrobacterales bacterium]|nr:hypothetical protein [Solirubrobacterales bacterium]